MLLKWLHKLHSVSLLMPLMCVTSIWNNPRVPFHQVQTWWSAMKVTSWRMRHLLCPKRWTLSGRGGGSCWLERLCRTTSLNVSLPGSFVQSLHERCDFCRKHLSFLSFFSDHCMVNFIKENLLGSVKEFRNRFINPIQNGQCADSTLHDVRIMKKRAHILYEMLAGCVQVREKKTKTNCLLTRLPFNLLPCAS